MSQAWEPSRGAGTGLKGPKGRALTRPVGPEGSCALRPLSGPVSRTTSETWDTRSQAEPLLPSGRLPAGSSLHPTGRETEAQMTNIPASRSEPAPGVPPPGLGPPLCRVGNRGHTGAPWGCPLPGPGHPAGDPRLYHPSPGGQMGGPSVDPLATPYPTAGRSRELVAKGLEEPRPSQT